MKLTFLGHSGWLVETSSAKIVIDPFLSDNPLAKHKASDIKADYIILSHAHGDHIADAEAIAKANNAAIIGAHEIATYYGARNCKTHAMNIGGVHSFPFGNVKLTPAWHSSSFPDGTYGGMPAGILLYADDKTLYHTGDTALFSDMQLIGKQNKVDVMLVCAGDNFTMGIDDAVNAVELVKPQLVAPMHYNTFPVIKIDTSEFATKMELVGYKVKIVNPAESFTL